MNEQEQEEFWKTRKRDKSEVGLANNSFVSSTNNLTNTAAVRNQPQRQEDQNFTPSSSVQTSPVNISQSIKTRIRNKLGSFSSSSNNNNNNNNINSTITNSSKDTDTEQFKNKKSNNKEKQPSQRIKNQNQLESKRTVFKNSKSHNQTVNSIGSSNSSNNSSSSDGEIDSVVAAVGVSLNSCFDSESCINDLNLTNVINNTDQNNMIISNSNINSYNRKISTPLLIETIFNNNNNNKIYTNQPVSASSTDFLSSTSSTAFSFKNSNNNILEDQDKLSASLLTDSFISNKSDQIVIEHSNNKMLSKSNSTQLLSQQANTTSNLPTTNSSNNVSSNGTLNTTTNNNTKNGISSTSYTDDSNLKMAIIDYADIVKLTRLHSCIDHQEWLAFNTKMYFDQINVLYGAIADYCTPQTCPTMCAPCNAQFYWLDEKGKKSKYSAPQYIDTVLTHTAKQVTDETLFPTKIGHPFPNNFEQLVKKIHKHLFQVLAHMYHSHYKELLQLKLNTYVNSIYFHLFLFNKNFSMLEDKDLEIMDSLNKSLINKYIENTSAAALQQQHHQPTIHQSSTTSATSNSSSSGSGGGFSFFKKKLNFNLMT